MNRLGVSAPAAHAKPAARPHERSDERPTPAAPPAYGHRVDGAPVFAERGAVGLPDELQSRVERASGLAMDDVRVHYDSPRPARLLAAAYTRGADIHVAPGHERELAHEAWHVVQQKQRRAGGGEDAGLEREASERAAAEPPPGLPRAPLREVSAPADGPIQRALDLDLVGQFLEDIPDLFNDAPLKSFKDNVSRDSKRYNVLSVADLRARRTALQGILQHLHDIDFHELPGGAQTAVDKLLRMVHGEIDAVDAAARAAEEADDDGDGDSDDDEAPALPSAETKDVAQHKSGDVVAPPKKKKKPKKKKPAAAAATREAPKLPDTGLVVPRLPKYLPEVRALELQLGKVAPKEIITLLFKSSMLLLPELAGCYPKLVIQDKPDDATFSRGAWTMTIPVPADLAKGTATNLRDVSTTVFHETRHIEQAWVEAFVRAHKRPVASGAKQFSEPLLIKDLGIPPAVFAELVKIEPKGNLDYIRSIALISPQRRAEQTRVQNEYDAVRTGGEFSALATESKGKKDELFAKYKAFPREADAFMAEGVYQQHYDFGPETKVKATASAPASSTVSAPVKAPPKTTKHTNSVLVEDDTTLKLMMAPAIQGNPKALQLVQTAYATHGSSRPTQFIIVFPLDAREEVDALVLALEKVT